VTRGIGAVAAAVSATLTSGCCAHCRAHRAERDRAVVPGTVDIEGRRPADAACQTTRTIFSDATGICMACQLSPDAISVKRQVGYVLQQTTFGPASAPARVIAEGSPAHTLVKRLDRDGA